MSKNTKYNPNKSGDLYWSAKTNRVYGQPVVMPEARISFPFLAEPRPAQEFNGQKSAPRYEATFLLDADSKEAKEFERQVLNKCKVMIALYNEKKPKNMPDLGNIKSIYKDGNGMDLDKYKMYEDKVFFTAKNSQAPDIIDEGGESTEAATVKGGMLCRAVIVPHFGAQGISFRLETLQLVEDDGVRFGGAKPDYKGLLVADSSPEGEEETEEEEDDTDTNGDDDADDTDSSDDDEEEEKEEAPKTAAKRGRPSLAEQAAARAAENAKKNKAGGKGLNAAKDLL